MEILYLLIPVSVTLVFLIGALFWWALNNQQFDGLDDEANRIFSEDDIITAKSATPSIDTLKPKSPPQ